MGKAPSQTTPVSGSFTVANTAITGTTRMSFDEIEFQLHVKQSLMVKLKIIP
jgi:hypothetical protein